MRRDGAASGARGRPRGRRRGRWLALLLLTAASGWAAKRWAETEQVFVVEVVALAACPDHLRAPAAAVLEPLVGQTFFEVATRADEMRHRLARLPEVADAELVCRPPNSVEVRLVPRVPTLAVRAGRQWLSVDAGGVIVRSGPRAEAELPQVYGLRPAVTAPGARIAPQQLAEAAVAVRACEQVLGAGPRALAFEPGGALRLRTAAGELVLLGQAKELEHKLYTYQVIRNRLGAAPVYVDVATPTAPAWLPQAAPGAAP